MKKLYFSWLLFLAVARFAWAMPEGPLYMYSQDADTIYDVKVNSIDEHKIAFSVVDVLRGKPVKNLVLRPMDFNIKKGDELMILSCDAWRKGEYRDAIGDLNDGQLGWIDARVFRSDSKVYVSGDLLNTENYTRVFDKKFGDWECLTLDHFKQLLAGQSFVTWDMGGGITVKKSADYASDVVIATFSPPDTWKTLDRDPYGQAFDMQVVKVLKGTLAGKVPVICRFEVQDKRPQSGSQYVAFLEMRGSYHNIFKLFPATKENLDAVKAVIAAK